MARAAKKKVVEAVPEVPANVVTVTQEEVIAIAELRKQIDDLADQKKALEKKLTIAEGAAISKLKTEGVVIEAGHYVATLDTHPGRCSPSWKDEAVKLAIAAGKQEDAYVEEVKALYPPKTVTDLVIVHACSHCGSEKEIK